MTSSSVVRTAIVSFFIAAVALLASGCAAIDGEPRYKTKTFRTPPSTVSGQRCLNQCDSTRLQCESNQNAETDRCELDRKRQYRDCKREASAARSYCARNRAPRCDLSYSNTLNTCQNRIRPCRRDYSRCRSLDDTCFQRCGGKIRKERVCVTNCDKVSATPKAPAAAHKVCKVGRDVRIAEKWPDGRPLRNKFCRRATCAVSGKVVRGPDAQGRCLIQPELSPVRDWVPYQLLTLRR